MRVVDVPVTLGSDRVVAEAHQLGFAVVQADCTGQTNSRRILHALGGALHLPDWYGGNFDALADVLADAEWLPGPGHLLCLAGCDAWRQARPADFATFLAVLGGAAGERRAAGQPFWVLVEADAGLGDPPGDD